MSRDKLSDYFQYRNVIKKLLLLGGLWPNENLNVFYRLLPFPLLFANLWIIVGAIGFIKEHSTNIAAVMKGLSIITSFLTIILKMMCVMVNRKNLNEIHVTLDNHFTKLLKNQQILTLILTNFRSFRCLSSALVVLVTTGTVLIVATPIISIIYQHLHSVNPVIYPYFYPTAYPWSVDPPGFLYKVHFMIELAAVVPYFCVSPSMDSLFMMYGFQMIGQFREMSYRITHIDEMSNDQKVIQECVLQHQSMMKCRDILQKIYGPILLWVITTNAIALCSMIFQLSQMKSMSISETLLSAASVWLKILQTFMYAYTGTCLTSESENFRAAIYDADWHTNRRFMTSILIMLSQKPIILTACNFSEVSLAVFVKFLNTTISYFFLLQTVS